MNEAPAYCPIRIRSRIGLSVLLVCVTFQLWQGWQIAPSEPGTDFVNDYEARFIGLDSTEWNGASAAYVLHPDPAFPMETGVAQSLSQYAVAPLALVSQAHAQQTIQDYHNPEEFVTQLRRLSPTSLLAFTPEGIVVTRNLSNPHPPENRAR